MKHFTLDELIGRSVEYEQWRAELDPNLKRNLIWAGYATFATIGFLLLLPVFTQMARNGFFLVLGAEVEWICLWLMDLMPILLTINLVAVGLYVLLLWVTQGLEKPPKTVWHWAAFGHVAFGALNGFILALTGALVILNILIWIFMIALMIIAIFIAFNVMLSS